MAVRVAWLVPGHTKENTMVDESSASTAEDQAPDVPATAGGDTDTPGTATEAPDPEQDHGTPVPPAGSGTDLEPRQPQFEAHAVLPSAVEWSNLMSMSKVIANSGLAPRVNGRPMTPEAVAVTALKGRELGIPPMMALSHIHVIEGRPTASAELMRSLVQRAGHYLAIVEQSPSRAVAAARRKDWPESVPTATVAYTVEEAQTAGLTGKGNWKKHPTDMLVARVTSRICRQLFADCLMGASYTPDELDAEVDYTVEGEIESVTVERDQPQRAERPVDDGTPITDGQKKKLSILVRELGIRTDDSDVLYRAGMMAAYGVDSIKDLSRHQASTLIEIFTNGTIDKETGEVTRSPEQVAKGFMEKGSRWLAEQEAAEAEASTADDDGDVVDAEIVEEGDNDGE